MTMLPLLALLISLILIALFAASEAVLAATNRVRLRHLLRSTTSSDDIEANTASGEATDVLSGETQRFIATVTIAANIPMLVAATLTVTIAVGACGFNERAVAVCMLVALFTIAVFQITPRLLVSRNGFRPSLWLRPARVLIWVLQPSVGVLIFLGQLLLRPFGLTKASPQDSARSETESDEIRDLVDDMVTSADRSGVLEPGSKDLFESIFTFGDTRVHEVMIPRPDILSLPASSAPDTILAALQESGYSRLPLHENDVDHIIGILHVNDVLRAVSEGQQNFVARNLMRPPMFLPEAQAIDEAFAAMRAARTHLAIAIDEFGGTAGLLTIEDILEELVGEIADEHDRKVEEPLTIVNESTAIADALLHIEDLEEQWGLALPSGEFDTVGGFVIEQLGRAPVIGDRVAVSGALLTVHALRGRRPHKIMIHKEPSSESGTAL